MKEIRLSRDTVIFLLHYLEFVLNLKKSFVNPMQETEFLGITINYLKMCLSLPQTFLTITTDASKKAYGAAYQTIPTGGNVIYSNKDFILIYWEKTSKTCIASTSQTVLGECCSFLKRQYSNPVLSCENGGQRKRVFNPYQSALFLHYLAWAGTERTPVINSEPVIDSESLAMIFCTNAVLNNIFQKY